MVFIPSNLPWGNERAVVVVLEVRFGFGFVWFLF